MQEMIRMDPALNNLIKDMKDPSRLDSPERKEEMKNTWHSEKIDENHYKVTKYQYWAGAIALGVWFFKAVVSTLKNLAIFLLARD